ncbi:hypothetical protein N9P20_00900 [Polaribacter sp.]|nr:hypothetical protein [Polaribacter sp.]
MKFLKDIEVQSGLKDSSGAIGSSGQILSSTGSLTSWIDISIPSGTVTGTGTTNRLTKFTDGANGTIGNSGIQDASNAVAITINGNEEVGINKTNPTRPLHVNGIAQIDNGSLQLGGTSSVTGSNPQFRRTNSSNDLAISTGGSDRITVLGTGNVGIGSTNPQAPLVISNSSAESLELNNNISSGSRIISYNRSNNTFRPLRLEGLTHIFGISGNERMRINSSGNVGIGATNPLNRLQVSGGSIGIDSEYMIRDNRNNTILLQSASTAASNRSLTIGNATYSNIIVPNGNVGIGTTSPEQKLDVRGDVQIHSGASATSVQELGFKNIYNTALLKASYTNPSQTTETYLAFHANTSGAGNGTVAEQMRIAGDKVGIGTTSPSQKLEVNGNAIIGGGTLDNPQSWGKILQVQNTGSNGAGISVKDSNKEFNISTYGSKFYISEGVDERITINSSGNVGIGTTSPVEKLHVEGNIELANSWTIGSSSGSYWQRIRTVDASATTTNAFNFETRNGSGDYIPHAVIRNDGNVGIGTTSPETKLEVTDTIQTTKQTRSKGWYTSGSGLALETGVSGGKGYVLSYNRTTSSYADTIIESTGVKFVTASSGKFYFTGGNVGIGTTSPGVKLDVNGTIKTNAIFRGDTLNNSANTHNIIYRSGTSTFIAGGDKLVVQDGGNVGIGTTSPAAKLHVSGGDVRLDDGREVIFDVSGTVTASEELIIDAGGTDSKIVLDGADSAMQLITGNSVAINIDDAQKVGVGTTSPSQLLHVAGNMRLQNQLYDSTNSLGSNGEVLTKVSAGTEWKAPAVNAQMPDNTAPASPANVGTIRYRSTSNTSFVDMSMQTGATTYAWVNIVSNFW